MLKFFKRNKECADPVNVTIKRIKDGDKDLKERFITNYTPFIIKTVSQVTGKYIELENSEEFSVGLLAFDEAIKSYNEGFNCSFINFASQVIKRRVLNYREKEEKYRNVYPFTYFEREDNSDFEETYLSFDSNEQFKSIEICEQMILFEKKLAEYGITFKDLVNHAPKHKDSKRLSIEIAKMISNNNYLYEKLDRKKNIPMVDLLKHVDVHQRTIERNRKFIIAVTLILKGEFDILAEFVGAERKGGSSFE